MSSSAAWTTTDIPDQRGRRVVITGASAGLGEVTARALAATGAHVVMAVRDVRKGEAAAASIRAAQPLASLDVRVLDLASLASVREFAAGVTQDLPRIDVLVNNAGIMQTPPQRTADGFEMQLGTNHLGHFALTGLLLEAITRGSAPRVVTLGSGEHRSGVINFADLQSEHDYRPRRAYQQSKMANTLFAFELDRRLAAVGSPVISVLAHPGYAATNLQSTGPVGWAKALMRVTNRVLAQSPERGALPQLYAATAPDVRGGQYVGPTGLLEMRGPVGEVRAVPAAYDELIADRLWEVSEDLTGVKYLS